MLIDFVSDDKIEEVTRNFKKKHVSSIPNRANEKECVYVWIEQKD